MLVFKGVVFGDQDGSGWIRMAQEQPPLGRFFSRSQKFEINVATLVATKKTLNL